MKIARVFPRKTTATPHDPLTFFTVEPPRMILPEIDEIHVSVTFTYDIEKAERMAEHWRSVGVPVKVGGPAYGGKGGIFTPGLYHKPGYTMTSRGCHNHCWFCKVPVRQGELIELEIKDGWDILDDNFLLNTKEHKAKVFEMLKRQPFKPEFTGGLEAKILTPWDVQKIREVKAKTMYFAYDTPDDYEVLIEAGKMLREGGITFESHKAGCYVLIGYEGDTFEKATIRLLDTIKAGFVPFAMLYKDDFGNEDKVWRKFQREWSRVEIVGAKMKVIREGMME